MKGLAKLRTVFYEINLIYSNEIDMHKINAVSGMLKMYSATTVLRDS